MAAIALFSSSPVIQIMEEPEPRGISLAFSTTKDIAII